MAQNITGMNNCTISTSTTNSILDYASIFNNIWNHEGIITGLVVSTSNPADGNVTVSSGAAVIQIQNYGLLLFQLNETITLAVPNLDTASNYLIVLSVDLDNATHEIEVIEGTSGTDPELTEGDDPEMYYLVLGKIEHNTTTTTVTSSELVATGSIQTNNTTPEIIGRSASITVTQSNTSDPTSITVYNDLVASGYKVYEFLAKDNTTNENSTDSMYLRTGSNLYDNRCETPYRLSDTGQYLDFNLSILGEVCPNPTHIKASSSTAKLQIYGTPSGATFQWDNSFGTGSGTDYWYDVQVGDTVYNVTRGQTATIQSWALNTCTVTNSGDIATWADNDTLKVVSSDLVGLIKNETGFSMVFNSNAYNYFVMRGDTSGDNLKVQIPGRSWVISGVTQSGGGSFDVYVDGSLVSTVDTSASSTSYNQSLYTYAPSTSITDNEDYVHVRHLLEIKPRGNGNVDIERVWVRNTRFSLNFHSSAPQEYMPVLLPVAEAIDNATMRSTLLAGISNLIYMNQLQGQSDDDEAWSMYLNWGDRTTFGYSGQYAWEQATYSSSSVYQTYPHQPTDTRSGFIGFELLVAYLAGRSNMSSSQKTAIESSITQTCTFLTSANVIMDVYTSNAALFHILTYIGGYYVHMSTGWTATTTNANGSIGASDTTISVDSVTGLSKGQIIKIGDEYIGISSISGTTLTVERALYGSTATTHSDNATVTLQDYDVFAKVLWYNLVHGDQTTNDPFLRWTVHANAEETDEAYFEELAMSTTLNNGGAVGSTDITIIVSDISDLGIDETEVDTLSGLSNVDIDEIAWQSGTTVRYTFNGYPDLSGVVVGDRLVVSGSTNSSNDGNFDITAIDNTNKYIEVTNSSRADATDDESSNSTAVADIKGDITLDIQIDKGDGTWEIARATHALISQNKLTITRSQDGSTATSSVADGSTVKRSLDWAYMRVLAPLLASIYYFAKEFLWNEQDDLRKTFKAVYNLARRRIDFDMGTYDSVGGSRLPNGGAEVSSLLGGLNILYSMGEGWRGVDMAVLWSNFAVSEINTYHYIADAERSSANDNSNRDLGAVPILFNVSMPLLIKLLETT